MKWLHKITGRLNEFSIYLQAFGPFGLFAVALLDSALIPLPGGPDAVMLTLSMHRDIPTMFAYALAGTAGSVIGCVILYFISKRAGRRALERFPPTKRARVKSWVDRYDVLSVLVASVLPPPFPFKLFVVTAGVFRLSLFRFVLAVSAGRLFRFTLEGYVAVRYGDRAKDFLAANYPRIGLGLAAVIVVAFILRGLMRRGKGKEGDEAAEANEQKLSETEV
ncbi:MAG: VTT domain-containing protein [Pyrinomonadaceae bacterium]